MKDVLTCLNVTILIWRLITQKDKCVLGWKLSEKGGCVIGCRYPDCRSVTSRGRASLHHTVFHVIILHLSERSLTDAYSDEESDVGEHLPQDVPEVSLSPAAAVLHQLCAPQNCREIAHRGTEERFSLMCWWGLKSINTLAIHMCTHQTKHPIWAIVLRKCYDLKMDWPSL